MPQYKTRAELHFGSYEQWSCSSCEALAQVDPTIPVNIGPFRVDWSPNQGFYFADVYGIDPERLGDQSLDRDFPVSALMVEMEGEVPEQGSSAGLADEELATFELLLRLFQPGDVSVRRHGFVYNPETGSPTFTWMRWGLLTPKPIVEPLYKRPPFHIHADTVRALQGFFSEYYHVVSQMPASVRLAFARFNASYEKRDIVDRLIDLIIALEALFTAGSPGEVTFKVALRCGFWLKPPGSQREDLFRRIKRAYGMRSDAVHGRSKTKVPTDKQLEKLEGIVRDCLRKYLDHQILTGSVPLGDEFDHLMLTGRLWPRPVPIETG